MIEHLRRALERVDALSLEAQEDLAAFIEEQALPAAEEPPTPPSAEAHLPARIRTARIRTALAAVGSARDPQDDDEFAALDCIR